MNLWTVVFIGQTLFFISIQSDFIVVVAMATGLPLEKHVLSSRSLSVGGWQWCYGLERDNC